MNQEEVYLYEFYMRLIWFMIGKSINTQLIFIAACSLQSLRLHSYRLHILDGAYTIFILIRFRKGFIRMDITNEQLALGSGRRVVP
jgi:hypothetical protein